ncbi:hypothetical protein ACTJIJ_19865 [Niabella sp. 22666]|uniref:hypothetical protein n=1 Tax=Niabella sp. 22666 TaxID=3453954 RepID=UPI003F824CE4
MEPTILRKDALALIHSGNLVDIAFVTADRRRGTGGNYITLKRVCKVEKDKSAAVPPSGRQGASRPANHHAHKTINLHDPVRSFMHIHKVHIRLIHFLNGKRVIQ